MTKRHSSPDIIPEQDGLFSVTEIPESQRGMTREEIAATAAAIGLAAEGLTPPAHRVSQARAELGGGTREQGPRPRPAYVRKKRESAPTPPPTHGTVGVDPTSPPDVAELWRIRQAVEADRRAGKETEE